MDTIEHSILKSLDGEDLELFPYLSYLLKDIWEIGACPNVILNLIKKNLPGNINRPLKIADLGCGKGAVSIKLAQKLPCVVTGIDALPDFIKTANYYAKQYNVSDKCHFEVGDIREKVKELTGFDYIILGSIGPVLGNTGKTLQQVQKCLNEQGMIILDEAYSKDLVGNNKENYSTLLEILKQIEKNNLMIIDQYIYSKEEMESSDEQIYSFIEKRALELIEKHPDKKHLFYNYMEAQKSENAILENDVECVTWVLQKK
ncbi:MAG: class I SAM-dependent methyltransferase [Calditrichia bacterium]|nr:class I SAM-dependent methyltransferase [Calditrichia bacterium]